ncbi:hypothetical protein Vadar_000054 [Vaccinium darrowii]|uniref:Uncharacterized protein n=1 Tax=Vaccinium darrowii TaxID=229202 RepID=A0ACB7XM55_9ERIC|nr:hypothetical protein Vadar_000054 [Vaccinium darrowii]
MSNPLIVVDKIVEYFVGKVCQSVARHVDFLFHYKQNLKTLEDEKNNLQQQRSNVQEKVDQAEHRGEAVDNKVLDWLQEADEASQGVDTFMDVKAVKENMHCFNFSCPDYISHYRLSRQAEKKAVSIKQLADKGVEIGTVSHPREDPPELEIPSSGDYEDFHSRQKVFEDIVKALKDSNVNMIGVYGTGGVGIPIAIGNKRCKVVLTSRKRNVLENMGVQEAFHIEFLSEQEAWNLFKKKVGNHVDSHDQRLRDTAWAVCNECKGLPVAINALGATLKGSEDMHAWEDALYKLKNSMLKEIEGIDPGVYASLRYWPEKATYEHCSVISLMPQDMGEFPNELICPKLHTLRLDCTVNKKFPLHIPDSFFGGMENLMVLDLNGVPMLSLPASLAKLAKLHMLCLNNCKLGDIAILKDLKDHLEILSLRGSNIKELPPEVGELTRLRLLDMTNCWQLVMIPRGVISKLVLLEELYMPMTFNRWEGTSAEREISNVSLDELMSLTHLTTLHIYIEEPALLPNRFSFENLARFRIIVGARFPGWWSEGTLGLENIHVENVLEFLLGNPTRKQSIRGNGFYPSTPFNHLDLANLISFYPKKLNTATSSGSSSAHAQMALFNDKAMFPALETLEISSLPEITEIWNKQILPIAEKTTELFCCQLSYMRIDGCGKLVNVVGGCPKIEAREMEKQKGKVVDDYVTCFPKVKTLKLKGLPNLESFCYSSARCQAQVPLFGHQAMFPALETLEISSLPEITEIWNKQILPIAEKTTESFCCQLSYMRIDGCGKLVNVVGGCPKIEAREMEKQKGKVVDDYVTCFPKVKTLELKGLPNLESFCYSSARCQAQVPLFNHQVAFPALEKLDIGTLPNITGIWDKKIRPAHQPFYPLHELYVEDCGKLVYVVPSNMLPQLCNLERLALDSCPMAEVIVDLEKKEEGTQAAANNTIIPFPELSFLRLQRLQKIKVFCTFISEEHRVFNTQVAFPKLEKLDVDTFGEIALMDASELSLKHAEFYGCDEVSTVVSPNLLRRLRFVDLLHVEFCRGAREVFYFDGLEVGQLTQVRKLYLNDLPQLTCLWNKDPHGLLALQSLEYLSIGNCPLLANLFTVSVAKALGGLKVFYLSSCSTMEAVIATNEGHTDVLDDDREIVFPKLEWLILKDLSNLKSFCTSNHNFNFPSLKRLVLKRCPKVQAFTSGSVLPQILLCTRGNECLMVEDLNKHLEQQHLKGDQETILDGEMKGDEDHFSYTWQKIAKVATLALVYSF